MVADTNSSESGRMTGARVFVGIGFLILGTSFIASTGVLIYEFANTDWLTMVLAHSHLFLFFPLLGSLGLVAFYLPSSPISIGPISAGAKFAFHWES